MMSFAHPADTWSDHPGSLNNKPCIPLHPPYYCFLPIGLSIYLLPPPRHVYSVGAAQDARSGLCPSSKIARRLG